jgi:GMP synthase-like glutamine amidotransferase
LKVRLHCLQHVAFEDSGCIALWARKRGHVLGKTRLYLEEVLPDPSEFDWLIVMGGPMDVHAQEEFPWLRHEKALIARAIENEKPVLGICLGAQIIAGVLGAQVYKNDEREIGWHRVTLAGDAGGCRFVESMPAQFTPLHWHEDTFDLPKGARRIFTSAGCINQGFLYGDLVVGLQFHLEMTHRGIEGLVENCPFETNKGKYVQSPEEIRGQFDLVKKGHELLYGLLNRMSDEALRKAD